MGRLSVCIPVHKRTLVEQMEEKYGVRLAPDSRILAWALRCAAWIYLRYQLHADGTTSYFGVRGKNYEREIYGFGECVYAKEDVRRQVRALPRMKIWF